MTKSRSAKQNPSVKPTRAEMAESVHSKHQHVTDAVHKVLRDAGLDGVRVHSVRYSVAHSMVSGPPACQPPCDPDKEDCVLDSSGGEVKWVCVPR